MNDGTAENVGRLRQIVFVAIALASYVLYGAAVRASHQQSQWDNERDSMAVAVSHLPHTGSPRGGRKQCRALFYAATRWTVPDGR